MEQIQDQAVATGIQNIAGDIQEGSEKTVSDEEELETTISYDSQNELFNSSSDWAKHDEASKQLHFEQCLDTKINNVGNLDISDAQLVAWTTFDVQVFGNQVEGFIDSFGD
nr:hypothetical protein Iba_chr03cCG2700 [Ipomoea batatas]